MFEIDLCEVGPTRYVVNFRYGKKGKRLTDGTKTTTPLGRDEAERVFLALVAEKKRKGYVDASAPAGGMLGAPTPPAVTAPARTLETPVEEDPRARTLLGYLSSPKSCTKQFKLRRVVWRAGELRLTAAAPALRKLLAEGDRALKSHPGQPPWQYGVLWAIARCRDPANIPVLHAARHNTSLPEPVRRIALIGLLDHLEGDERQALCDELQRGLPAPLAEAVSDLESLRPAIASHLQSGPEDRHDALFQLYLLDTPVTRTIIHEQLATLVFAKPGFRAVRHIFKAAELREDGEIFGVLARRFEVSRAGSSPRWGVPREDTAYGPGTRRFLRRRTWRTLRRLGEAESEGFIPLASGVLLAFGDEDLHTRGLPWCLGQLLYGAHQGAHRQERSLTISIQPEDAAGDIRGEHYPQLWDRQPVQLVTLMLRSQCRHVHVFAARAFRASPDAWPLLGKGPLLQLLASPYRPTVALAADVAIHRHDRTSPDLELVSALARCAIPAARATALGWISEDTSRYLTNVEFTARLLLAPYDDTRRRLRDALASTLVPASTAQSIVARVLSELLRGERDEATSKDLGASLGSVLSSVFSAAARSLNLEVIRDLLEHPHEGVQHLGATLLLAHDVRPRDLPPELLASAMLSAHPSVRAVGVRLFGELPDTTLIEREAVLVELCANPHAEVRQAVRPIVGRLSRSYPPFARTLLLSLLERLIAPEPQEGLHAELVALIRAELQTSLHGLELPPIWTLLHADTAVVQELGGQLLGNVDASGLELWRIAKLTSHDVLSVRQASWGMLRENISRLKADMSAAPLVLDATWDDSRAFAFEFFGEHFVSSDFTPTLLISICDSIRPDVQQFGRSLVTRFFAEEDGAEYLSALSQHPTASMQLFATNYLERFATGSPERIGKLHPYFRSVLCRVNQGRVAKKRVLAFLRREALSDAAVAADVAALLTELSLSIAIEYRAAAIEVLNAIRHAHRGIAVPLAVRIPTRRSGTRAITRGPDAV